MRQDHETAPGRRTVLKALVSTLPGVWVARQAGAADPPASRGLRFFNDEEAAAMDAIADRLIPSDAHGPGGKEAGVTAFLDGQLAGAWGAGDHFYRQGPFFSGTPEQGYQLALTPAQLFRRGLAELDQALRAAEGQAFAGLPPERQDRWLMRMQQGELDLDAVPAPVLFQALLDATIEGYFCDPIHGGNAGMAGWRLVGFPGAYASFAQDIERHGAVWRGEPVSIADGHRAAGGGHG